MTTTLAFATLLETFFTERSTVVRRVTHAGIVRVERFTFPS